MITVLIRVTHGPEALAATLSVLVSAVADGLVADAIIITSDDNQSIAEVAEAAGASLVVDPGLSWDEGARRARKEWLLCLDSGDLPQEGWIRVLDRFVSLAGDKQNRARLRRQQGLVRSIVAGFRNLAAPSAIRAGDLVHRRAFAGERKLGLPPRLAASIERDSVLG